MPPDLCCTHPPRALSPTEPARPALFNLDGIFAVAALPDDHPHGLRLPDRKPPAGSAKSLIRSPSIAAKLKGQLRRRRTLRSLKCKGGEADVKSLRAEVWDEDARIIGSSEVGEIVGGIGGSLGTGDGSVAPVLRLRLSPLNSSPDLRQLEELLPSPSRKVRSSMEMRREENWVEKPKKSGVNIQSWIAVGFGTSPAFVSDLATHQVDGTVADAPSAEGQVIVPSTSGSLEDAVLDAANKVQLEQDVRPASSRSLHLPAMNISEQLRSMSQMSESMDKNERLTPESWTFHRRERSMVGLTSSGEDGNEHSRHARQTSLSGVDSTQIPASWGQVRRDRDNSSSVYSRPTSPEEAPHRIISTEMADWPLKENELSGAALTGHDGTVDDGIELHDLAPARLTPSVPQAKPSSATLSVPQSQSVSHLAPPERAASQRSGSSTMTKRSRFLERFTPPSRLVKKRRSMFKFLRPGSRRQQPRSISTPVLRSTPGKTDGAADDEELLTVQYELTQPQSNIRSMSLNNLPSCTVSQDDEERDISTELLTRPSLADYERKLSILGDDRRRPSAVNLGRLSQIQEDDRHGSASAKKRSRRGSQARDNPLMEAALERQLAEKALFRSARRRSGPVTPTEPSAPSFATTTWGEPTVSTPQSPERDPLDPVLSSSVGKKASETHLSPPRTPLGGRSTALIADSNSYTGSQNPILLETPSLASQPSAKSKIGSPLSSWARFPSHNRIERCASAGPDDNVITRDFALEIKHENATRAASTEGKRTPTDALVERTKNRLTKSRSATFSNITRNLSSIFSGAEFHAKGRRTSVAVGGRLEYPELEVLPPMLPVSGHSRHSQHMLRRSGNTKDWAEKAIHPAYRDDYQAGDDAAMENISLRHASVSHEPVQERSRLFSMVDPSEDLAGSMTEDNENTLLPERRHVFPSDRTDSTDSRSNNHNLDGASDPPKSSPPSKSELFADEYQVCIHRPTSTDLIVSADAKLMAPPTLKPSKCRSLEPQSQHLNPGATVRRFPSVTVVDDRKGHWRSVSFISVQSRKSAQSGTSGASFVRESSNDLLKVMRMKEQEEREKLMSGEGDVVAQAAVV